MRHFHLRYNNFSDFLTKHITMQQASSKPEIFSANNTDADAHDLSSKKRRGLCRESYSSILKYINMIAINPIKCRKKTTNLASDSSLDYQMRELQRAPMITSA